MENIEIDGEGAKLIIFIKFRIINYKFGVSTDNYDQI